MVGVGGVLLIVCTLPSKSQCFTFTYMAIPQGLSFPFLNRGRHKIAIRITGCTGYKRYGSKPLILGRISFAMKDAVLSIKPASN